MTEGTTSRSALDIAIEEETLGASLSVNAGSESTTAFLSALSPNLVPSLELMADVVRNPAFAPDALERVRSQRMAAVAQELSSPAGLANRAFMPLVYGERHPYAHASASGDAEVIEGLTRADMIAEHAEWIRPETATITAVGDVSMDALVAALEARWATGRDRQRPFPPRMWTWPPPPAMPRASWWWTAPIRHPAIWCWAAPPRYRAGSPVWRRWTLPMK